MKKETNELIAVESKIGQTDSKQPAAAGLLVKQ